MGIMKEFLGSMYSARIKLRGSREALGRARHACACKGIPPHLEWRLCFRQDSEPMLLCKMQAPQPAVQSVVFRHLSNCSTQDLPLQSHSPICTVASVKSFLRFCEIGFSRTELCLWLEPCLEPCPNIFWAATDILL